MNRYLLFLLFFTGTLFAQSEKQDFPFQSGEWLKYRLHYGMVTAGYATLQVKDGDDDNIVALGDGWTIGMFKWFFNVDDHYESHFNKYSLFPDKFIRDVSEGGYTINREVSFDRINNTVTVEDKKEDERADSLFVASPSIGDMLSSYYYARAVDYDTLKAGDKIDFDVFMDYEIFGFSLYFLGRETIDTEFGKIKCLKFAPLVQSGRVFKEDEGVLMWISDDDNKILIRVESALRVGTIKVSLAGFKGLKHSFKVTHQ
ncbi:MAG: DUF3108 domain-containing protein [Flavobacteriales bacterium]|nr:DUF3108 domain-containing protein [Flavobacteriales bacterium]